MIAAAMPLDKGAVLELGTGAGFLREFIPILITSELFDCSQVQAVLDALHLPFASRSLRGIVMPDFLYHMPDPDFCRGSSPPAP